MSRRPPRRQPEIRPATSDDVEDVLALWGRSLGETPARSGTLAPEQVRERLREALAKAEPEVLVVRVAERTVAFLVMRQTPLNVLTGTIALCLDEFYVAEEERRHGVGRAMLAHVTGHAERLGVEQIIAGVPPWSKGAQRYFAKLGFAPVMVRRAIAPSALRRRLAGADAGRGGRESLLSRRRSLRARAGRAVPPDDAPVTV